MLKAKGDMVWQELLMFNCKPCSQNSSFQKLLLTRVPCKENVVKEELSYCRCCVRKDLQKNINKLRIEFHGRVLDMFTS